MGNSTNDPKGASELPAKAGAIKKKCARRQEFNKISPPPPAPSVFVVVVVVPRLRSHCSIDKQQKKIK